MSGRSKARNPMKYESKVKTARKDSFEASLKNLEEIVQRLEGGELTLEESLRLFEEGVRLTRVCAATLEEADRRIAVLMKREDGSTEEVPADPEAYAHREDDAEGEGEAG